MDYSITQAAAATGRSPDSVRRAIRAGKLEATKLDAGYLITTDALAARAGKPLISPADQATELKAARHELEVHRREIETLENDLRDAKNELETAVEIIGIQRDSLTQANRSLDRADESQRLLAATVAALNTRLEALPPGKTRRPWFRQRSTENRPPAEH